ncbi:hypothetical protein QTP88_017538 [Uroleucon formosanum]
MAPKRKAELMRESRKRKRDNELRYRDEFFLFIRDTPFCSNTTDSEKFEAFLRLRDSNAPKPASNAENLWFEKDMKHVPQKAVDFLLEKYPDLDSHNMSVCNTCYKTLLSNKVPRFATINGFCYPPFPSDLPPIDPISERLVSVNVFSINKPIVESLLAFFSKIHLLSLGTINSKLMMFRQMKVVFSRNLQYPFSFVTINYSL